VTAAEPGAELVVLARKRLVGGQRAAGVPGVRRQMAERTRSADWTPEVIVHRAWVVLALEAGSVAWPLGVGLPGRHRRC
jgi:hypothetical protein